jgi:hypothetical protein
MAEAAQQEIVEASQVRRSLSLRGRQVEELTKVRCVELVFVARIGLIQQRRQRDGNKATAST